MATTAVPRKTASIHDYPEHLNPFHENDNHEKIRFWTLGRRLSRSNSINFSGIKELKNSWALRSFMKKSKKIKPEQKQQKENGDTSPIVYRRAVPYSSSSTGIARTTIGSPERPERYVYGGSVTPLPRSRFQERLRSPSQAEVNSVSGGTPRMARSEISGSRLSVESSNPFDEHPVPPARACRRKKKKAPLPPSASAPTDITVSSLESDIKEIEEPLATTTHETSVEAELVINEATAVPKQNANLEIEEVPLNIELKIVEDDDNKSIETKTEVIIEEKEVTTSSQEPQQKPEETNKEDTCLEIVEVEDEGETVRSKSNENILDGVSFPKVDISKYRRNSSLNEDDIKLRRGNLEDYHEVSSKRSKSLNTDLNLSYVSYDINLNENSDIDANCNELPQRVVCKLYDEPSRKQSLDNSISSTEKEFIEIDKATRELEREISKLNSALFEEDDDSPVPSRLSVSDIKKRFDGNGFTNPNPIPKPRRSHHGSTSPINGN